MESLKKQNKIRMENHTISRSELNKAKKICSKVTKEHESYISDSSIFDSSTSLSSDSELDKIIHTDENKDMNILYHAVADKKINASQFNGAM